MRTADERPTLVLVTAADVPATLDAVLDQEWTGAIATWINLVLRAAGRPSTTIGLRSYQLRRLAAAMLPLGPWQVTGDDLLGWFGSQSTWCSNDTRRSYSAAVRSFYQWAYERGDIEVDPSKVLPSIKPAAPNPRPAPEDTYRVALAAAHERERLMLRLPAELGMRRGEVAVAHRDDLQRFVTGWQLTVHGKGNKTREVPVPPGLAAMIREAGPGYLFPGRINGHLSAAYTGRLVSRLMPGVWTMHTLRHRFATVLVSSGHGIEDVQELLGHASLDTTRRYVLVASARLRRAVETVAAM